MVTGQYDELLASVDRLRALVVGMQSREERCGPPVAASDPSAGASAPGVEDLLRTVERTMVDPAAKESGTTLVLALVHNTKDHGQSSTVACTSEADIERTLVADDELVGFATAFANPARLRIMRALAGTTCTSAELTERTGLVGGQLYHHLKELVHGGFVRQEARNAYTLTMRVGMPAYLGLNLLAGTVRHGRVAEPAGTADLSDGEDRG